MLNEYVITFVTDEGKEDVISVSAVSKDAAAHYSSVPFNMIVDVEETVCNVKKANYF